MTKQLRCDTCEQSIEPGEVYYETLTTRRVAGGTPPMYAAKTYECEACDAAKQIFERLDRHGGDTDVDDN